jgi:hypothetical protein
MYLVAGFRGSVMRSGASAAHPASDRQRGFDGAFHSQHSAVSAGRGSGCDVTDVCSAGEWQLIAWVECASWSVASVEVLYVNASVCVAKLECNHALSLCRPHVDCTHPAPGSPAVAAPLSRAPPPAARQPAGASQPRHSAALTSHCSRSPLVTTARPAQCPLLCAQLSTRSRWGTWRPRPTGARTCRPHCTWPPVAQGRQCRGAVGERGCVQAMAARCSVQCCAARSAGAQRLLCTRLQRWRRLAPRRTQPSSRSAVSVAAHTAVLSPGRLSTTL